MIEGTILQKLTKEQGTMEDFKAASDILSEEAEKELSASKAEGVGIKHAAELWKNSPNGEVRKVKLGLWENGAITSCEATYDKEGKEIKGTCYTTEPGQEEAFWAFQAHLTSPEVGYKVKSIEVEAGHSSPPTEIEERITAGADVP